jgi:hypothetical protein
VDREAARNGEPRIADPVNPIYSRDRHQATWYMRRRQAIEQRCPIPKPLASTQEFDENRTVVTVEGDQVLGLDDPRLDDSCCDPLLTRSRAVPSREHHARSMPPATHPPLLRCIVRGSMGVVRDLASRQGSAQFCCRFLTKPSVHRHPVAGRMLSSPSTNVGTRSHRYHSYEAVRVFSAWLPSSATDEQPHLALALLD